MCVRFILGTGEMAQQFRALTAPAESQLPATPIADNPLQVSVAHMMHIPAHS